MKKRYPEIGAAHFLVNFTHYTFPDNALIRGKDKKPAIRAVVNAAKKEGYDFLARKFRLAPGKAGNFRIKRAIILPVIRIRIFFSCRTHSKSLFLKNHILLQSFVPPPFFPINLCIRPFAVNAIRKAAPVLPASKNSIHCFLYV